MSTSSTLSLIAAGLVLAGCSGASDLRRDASERMPDRGPVASARDAESAAVDGRAPAASTVQQPAQPLTLDACIAWTLEHNRDLRQQIGQAERSRLGITVARSQAWAPVLTASASRTRSDLAGSDPSTTDSGTARLALTDSVLGFTVSPYATQGRTETDGSAVNPYSESVGFSVSRRILALHEWARLSQPLTAADRAWSASVNTLNQKVRRTAADAAQAFLAVQQAEARMRLREGRLAQSAISLKAVREAVAAGLKAPVEETNALIEHNQAEADLLSDRTEVASARDRLLSLMDLPQGGELAIVPMPVVDVQPQLPGLEADLAAVRADHEELRNLRIDLDAAMDQVRFQADAVRPDVTASVAAERRWSGSSPAHAGNQEDVVTFTLAMAMPMDGWAGARAELAIRERAVRDLRIRIRNREADLERDVRGLRRRIDRIVTSVRLAQQRLEAETSKFRATEASYQTGRVDNLELTRARQSLDQAEVNLLESRIDLVLALRDRDVLIPPAERPR